MRIFSLIALIAVFVQPMSSGAAARPQPCTSASYHQFDFWVGNWKVRAKDGSTGTNRVTREFNGCVVQEHWAAANGERGSSFNTYDTAFGEWHQTYVDTLGQLVVLNGQFRDGKMVLSGTMKSKKGKLYLQRISWSPLPNKTVEQIWQYTRDKGKTWTTVFDGIYSPM